MTPAARPGRPLSLLDAMAERHIHEAQARGEFDGLPGAGAPLPPDDNELVPEELRAGYRLLKNAGCLPAEITHCGEVRDIEMLLQHARDDERNSLLARMHWLLMHGNAGRTTPNLRIEADYAARLAERLAQFRRAG